MTKLSKEQVQKTASLIKIHLQDDEIEKFQNQLSRVLDSVDVLKELDTSKTPETSQTHGLVNVLAEDVVKNGLNIKDYPNKSNLLNDYFTVKRVIN